MEEGKFYWLKLKKDFFDRDDIRIIERQDNGKDYVLFYLKLLLKSIENGGSLRFTDTIPYDEKMLSIITDTNIDIVRAAMKILTSSGLIEILDDDTIFMSEVQSMIGFETKWAEKKRKYREKLGQKEDNVLALSDKSIEIEKELDIEIDKDISPKVDISLEKENIKKKETSRFTPPSVDEVREYCLKEGYGIDPERFVDFYESKGWMIGKNKMKSWKAAVRTWVKNNKSTPQKSDNPYEDMMREEGIYDPTGSNYFIE